MSSRLFRLQLMNEAKQLCGMGVLIAAPEGEHDCQPQMRELADRIRAVINDFEPRAEVKILAAVAKPEVRGSNMQIVEKIFGTRDKTEDSIVRLDLKNRRARVNGVWVKLTPTEFRILNFLAQNPISRTRREIMEQAWSDPSVIAERTLDVHIRRLRERIGDRDEIIESIRSVGYRFNPYQKVEIK